jgi:hypothetical protein
VQIEEHEELLGLSCTIVGSFAQQNVQLGTCTFCNMFVGSLSGYATKTVTKQDLLNALTSVSKDVCPKMPAEFMSAKQCSSVISLYGPYTVDMILSQTSTQQICSSLELCESSATAESAYTVLFPTIDEQNQQVVYTTSQKGVRLIGQKFNYRIFLGNPSFLEEETLTVELSPNTVVDFDFVVTNKKDITMDIECTPHPEIPCSTLVGRPGRGTWYYIELTTKYFTVANDTDFTLTATVQNEVITNEGAALAMQHRKTHVFPFILPILLIAICLCCCCVRRRKQCKRQCKRADLQSQQEIAVEMNQVPVMGYYYGPDGQAFMAPQYVQVPMQGMPQPVFIPIAQPE